MAMKKRWFAAALACLLAISFAAEADLATFAVVTGTSSLNVRSGPGTEYAKLGTVAVGSWVSVTGSSGTWRVADVVGSALSGYMSAGFLKSADPSVQATAVVDNPVAAQFLNLRQSPSYSAPVLGKYYNGAVCTVLSESGGWYYVSIDGIQGYFRGEYLNVSGGAISAEKATVKAASGNKVNMRSGPGLGYSLIAQVTTGTVVSVLLKGNGFWMIASGGSAGFMASEFLTLSGSGGAYGVVTNPVSTQKLNLRENSNTTAKILGQYGNGKKVAILAQGTRWCKVTVDQLTGYMQTGYLTLHGLPSIPLKKTADTSGGYVNMRRTASSTGTVITRVPSGKQVTVLTPGDIWTLTRYGGTEGYIASSLLK
jgi:uncharacterized protein YgiM (DUF1202 family)